MLFVLVGSYSATENSQPGTPDFKRNGAKPMFDFGGVQKDIGSKPTRVLVLGTKHLAQLKKQEFEPEHLSLVIDKLTAFSQTLELLDDWPI